LLVSGRDGSPEDNDARECARLDSAPWHGQPWLNRVHRCRCLPRGSDERRNGWS